jgi:hypothetical protein
MNNIPSPNITLDENYWQSRWEHNETQWDTGSITLPLKCYFDQLTDRNLKILIPGAGNGYEAEYLWNKGFKNVTVIEIAIAPLEKLAARVPGFPKNQLVHQDFFEHQGAYDLIVEQTFFCALHPSMRNAWVTKMHELLAPNGKVMGLLFEREFDTAPPFGGDRHQYRELLEPVFKFKVFEPCTNSIPPRLGKELFILLEK